MTVNTTAEIVNRCISFGDEKEWFEFKDSIYKPDDIVVVLTIPAARIVPTEYKDIRFESSETVSDG